MHSNSPQHEILGIFAKYPEPGYVKSRLGKEIGDALAAELYQCFVHDLIDSTASAAEQFVFAYSPASSKSDQWASEMIPDNGVAWNQPEGDLGERIAAFFEAARELGGSKVVLIGSDSPTLPVSLIREAFEALSTSDCVLGPSMDGGYYLVGLSIAAPELFEGVSWSGPLVLQQTMDRIQDKNLSLHLLPPWYDLDNLDNLLHCEGHLKAIRYLGDHHVAPSTFQAIQNWRKLQEQSLSVRNHAREDD